MRTLNVWLEASALPIGQLVVDDGGATAFVYAPEWLADPAAHALSLSLPLREQPFGDAITRAWFDNLLQENDQLDRTMAEHGIDRGDVVGILEHIGKDCAGAVSVLPLDHPPLKRPGELARDYDLLDEQELIDIIRRLTENRDLPDQMRDPSPVAGFRRKISLTALPGPSTRFGLPKVGTGAPTTHILKVPDPRHRHEQRDEAFATLLAAQCGLPVGTCLDSALDGIPFLLIQRFDRLVDATSVYRIHQEDFAQAAGLPARLKYERSGRPGRRFDAGVIGRILAATDQPALARQLFLRLTLFNLMVGNTDNHAKNHALLHFPGMAPRLTPFYDIVPVQVVDGYTPELAFQIGAATIAEHLTRADLVEFCEAIGIPRSGAETVLHQTATELLERLEVLSAGFPAEHSGLDRLLGQQAAQLNELLTLGLDLRQRDAHVTRGGGWLIS